MTYTLSLADELKRLSHQVTILSPGQHDDRFTDQSISVVKINHTKTYIPIVPFVWRFFPLLIDRLKWMISVRTFIKNHEPFDIIECPEWGSSTLLLSLAKGHRLVTRVHKSLLQYHKDNNVPITVDLLFINLLELLSIALATGVTSPTHYILKSHPTLMMLCKLFQVPMAVIPNGIHINDRLIHRSTRTPYILTVGRLEKGKGQLLLIQAFARIANKVPFVNLIIIGRDTQYRSKGSEHSFKKKLEAEIIKTHLKKRVIIKKQMTQLQLTPYYQRCLLYIAPSLGHENHPLALLDAIGHGKAAIGNDTGGIPEIIRHKQNGLLFQTDDVSSLAKNLQYLIQKNTIRTKYEKYNLIYRHRFDIKRTTMNTIDFYNKLPHIK